MTKEETIKKCKSIIKNSMCKKAVCTSCPLSPCGVDILGSLAPVYPAKEYLRELGEL